MTCEFVGGGYLNFIDLKVVKTMDLVNSREVENERDLFFSRFKNFVLDK